MKCSCNSFFVHKFIGSQSWFDFASSLRFLWLSLDFSSAKSSWKSFFQPSLKNLSCLPLLLAPVFLLNLLALSWLHVKHHSNVTCVSRGRDKEWCCLLFQQFLFLFQIHSLSSFIPIPDFVFFMLLMLFIRLAVVTFCWKKEKNELYPVFRAWRFLFWWKRMKGKKK